METARNGANAGTSARTSEETKNSHDILLRTIGDCASLFSGLRPTFSDNLLQGTASQPVVTERVYEMNPNDSFRGNSGTIFTPYP